MKSVKVTSKLKQHYIDKGYIDDNTPVGTIIEIDETDYISPKSSKTFTVWMIMETKCFKDIINNYQITQHNIEQMKEVCEYITNNIDEKRLTHLTTHKMLANFIKYDVEGSYLERFLKIINTPKHERTDSCEYLRLYYGNTEGNKRCKEKSERVNGENNPGYEHGGKYSPFSKNFVKYEGLTEEETEQQVKEINDRAKQSFSENGNNSLTIQYYLDRGYSEEEGRKFISERQSTFSLEKCIEKLGEEEGKKRWLERQEKWQSTLNDKSDEEKREINKKKLWKNGISSVAEYELFHILKEHINDLQQQLCINRNDSPSNYFYDMYVGNKIIEYNGDYWHMNPLKYTESHIGINNLSAKEIWNKDKMKISMAESMGYDVHVVWESDYKNNKEKVIEECLIFLTQ